MDNETTFENGKNLSGVVSDIVLIGKKYPEGMGERFAEEMAEYLRTTGKTMREIEEETELRTSPEFVYRLGIFLGIQALMNFGFTNEAGFDRYGGEVFLDGTPDEFARRYPALSQLDKEMGGFFSVRRLKAKEGLR